MSKNNEIVEVECVFAFETREAFAVENPNYNPFSDKNSPEYLFLPKSLVEADHGTFTMPQWLAEEKDLV